jgi:hypothetical protein
MEPHQRTQKNSAAKARQVRENSVHGCVFLCGFVLSVRGGVRVEVSCTSPVMERERVFFDWRQDKKRCS